MNSGKSPEPTSTLLSLSNPDDLHWEMQAVQLAVARRAYELFEKRGREHGHDWEDWFRAESELLRPASVLIKESGDHISIRANVLGFAERELRVSVEPHQVMILGKKEALAEQPARGKTDYIEPDLIFKTVELPSEVLPESTIVEFQTGVLSFELLKTAQAKTKPAAVAA
jgi:HSP20 family molecular chaperone IbpA